MMNELDKIVNEQKNFFCPKCDSKTQHHWEKEYWSSTLHKQLRLRVVVCDACEEVTFWGGDKIIYPKQIFLPLAHADMPGSVKEFYNEAREVSNDSKRASAALLRVSLEKLTEELGENTGNLNERIKNLNNKGLPQAVIDSLDIVRVNGNEGGSHVGEIDLTNSDDGETISKLFWLINFIIEKTITEPNEINKQFDKLPPNKIKGISDRDK